MGAIKDIKNFLLANLLAKEPKLEVNLKMIFAREKFNKVIKANIERDNGNGKDSRKN